MSEIIVDSNGFSERFYDGWFITEAYLREIFPMQPSGVLMPPTYDLGIEADYRLCPTNVMSKFDIILGRAVDEDNQIFLFPTTVGLLRMEVGINPDWIFIEFGDVITWFKKDGGDWLPFCTGFNDEEY